MKLYLSGGSDIAETSCTPGKAFIMFSVYWHAKKWIPSARMKRVIKIRKKARMKKCQKKGR